MRLLLLLLLTCIIALTCGPKVTETTPTNDGTIRLSGKVIYSDSTGKGAPAVWVVYGFQETDSTAKTRIDSVMTDTLGLFLFTGVVKGALHYELYREPRIACHGGLGDLTVLYHETDLTWVYLHRPSCENFWPPDTTDSM